MDSAPQNIYNPEFVEQLFSQMSGTYDQMNTITSFGFSVRWRRQCTAALHLQPAPYLFYLKRVIPKLGKLFLGNPETYRMLGVYTELFKNSQQARKTFERAGFEVQYLHFFAGCASGIYGKKH